MYGSTNQSAVGHQGTTSVIEPSNTVPAVHPGYPEVDDRKQDDRKPIVSNSSSPSPQPDNLPSASAVLAGDTSAWSQRTRSLMGFQVVGTGSYVPDQIVTNADLEARYGFEPGWIEQRTGILQRRHAAPNQATSDLCVEAAIRAIADAKVSARDIDLVVVGTFTPDFQCPTTANLVQERLGIDAPAFDLQAACSGFVYALATAAQYVATGNSHLALVIGGDCNSRIVNPHDIKTAPLFGDGAGAVLLAKGSQHQGLVCYQLGSDGSGGNLLDRPSGGSRSPATSDGFKPDTTYLRMDGKNVFKWAVRALEESIRLVLRKSGTAAEDVNLYLLHQANIRIIRKAMEDLSLAENKMFNNLHNYGNTSGASIPLVLDEALKRGLVTRGDRLVLSGFGAGLTWGTCLMQW